MKVLVTAKHTIDHNIKVRVRSDNSGVDTDNIKMSLNPFDEVAIEEAVRLKEKNIVNEIVTVSIGNETAQSTLRSALALGATKAILIKTDQIIEPLIVGEILTSIVKKEEISLCLLGKQSIDGESNQVGQILSYHLGWSLATSVSSLNIDKEANLITTTQETDNGARNIRISMPAVITCDLQLNAPRFPNMMSIMQAKRHPIEQIDICELRPNIQPMLEFVKVEEPPIRTNSAKILNNIEEVANIINQNKLA